jgi:hypothetical protein
VAAVHIVVANEPLLGLEVLEAPELEDPLELLLTVVVVAALPLFVGAVLVLPGDRGERTKVGFGVTVAAVVAGAPFALEELADESPPQPANKLVQTMELRIE